MQCAKQNGDAINLPLFAFLLRPCTVEHIRFLLTAHDLGQPESFRPKKCILRISNSLSALIMGICENAFSILTGSSRSYKRNKPRAGALEFVSYD